MTEVIEEEPLSVPLCTYTASLWTGFLVTVLLLLLLLLLLFHANRHFRDFSLFNIDFKRRNCSSTR